MADDKPSVLFSQAHGERLRVDDPEAELPCTQWAKALRDRDFEVDPSEAALTEQELEGRDVLVLGSPLEPLSHPEIDIITGFVDRGGGLLLISDAQAVRRPTQNLSELGKGLLCQFREYMNAFPMRVEEFWPHYVTAGLISLTTSANCRLVTLSEDARPLAIIQETDERFAVCTEVGDGRIIAVADSAIFTDQQWEMASNSLFALQCCTWLARRNPIDLLDVTVDSQIELGREGHLVLTLANPWGKPLRHAKCILEANTDIAVTKGSQEIYVLPPNQRVQLKWGLQPATLGRHQLRLGIETAAGTGGLSTIWFDRIAEFMCTAPVSLKLELTDEQGQPKTSFTTGKRFRVHCSVEWRADNGRRDLPLELSVPDEIEIVHTETFGDTVRWYLQGNTPGHYDAAVTIPATGQQWAAGLSVQPSLDWQLENIEKDYVEPLDAEIVRRLVRANPDFGDKSVAEIPFRMMSPENYIRTVYPSSAINAHFRDVLMSARRETRFNLRLLNEILLNVAPSYSPRYGACVPYDPELASRWAQLHPADSQSLLYNFLQLEGSDPATIRQNVATYLLHEKYGHGFFFVHTRLGQQLATLDQHLFLREVDEEMLAVPYPRGVRKQYAEAIKALYHSAIIVNEGFAAWVELNFLTQMESEIAAAAHSRRIFLIWKATRLRGLTEKSSYFQHVRPLFDSPYQEGCEKLEAIQRLFGDPYGEKCAVQAFLKAADVSLGIKQGADAPEFSLSPEEMLDALTNPERPDDARSDRRLRRIFNVLVDNQDRLRSAQRRLLCHRECPHPACPVHDLVTVELGW